MPEPIIGFSEFISPMDNEGILYHVEWLTDEQSFPSLSPQSSIKEVYSSDMDWQLIDQAEHTSLSDIIITSTAYVDGEAEFWELIHHAPSYAKMATNVQDQLADSSPIYPFSSLYSHSDPVFGKIESNTIIKEDGDEDDFYHIYETRKSHGSHSYFGNKNYFLKKTPIACREYWSYCRSEIDPDRHLHQCVNMISHAKQYKPPGPRNANKNKEGRNLKPQNRLEL